MCKPRDERTKGIVFELVLWAKGGERAGERGRGGGGYVCVRCFERGWQKRQERGGGGCSEGSKEEVTHLSTASTPGHAHACRATTDSMVSRELASVRTPQ